MYNNSEGLKPFSLDNRFVNMLILVETNDSFLAGCVPYSYSNFMKNGFALLTLNA